MRLPTPTVHVCSGLTLVVIVVLLALPVQARFGGITGRSGKRGTPCNACHSGGVPPSVRFEGPTEVAAGQTGAFRFVVESQSASQQSAGFNVATKVDTLGTVLGQNARLSGGELTHTQPKQATAAITMWEFAWTAPAVPGSNTLFGAGNSVNSNFATSGDRASTTTMAIEVVGGLPTPTFSFTPLPTDSPTVTVTRTRTFTNTATPTITQTTTRTATRTRSPTVMPTATRTDTRTPTPHPSDSATATQTPTQTSIGTDTGTPQPTPTPRFSVPPTASLTPSQNPTPTQSFSSTAPASATTVPTFTPTPLVESCVGDCDGDGSVIISELILAVNIVLGTAPLEECPSLDANGDRTASISEVVTSVNNTLAGCL